MPDNRTYTAFAGERLVASGDMKTTVLGTKEHLDAGETEPILIFEDQTGRQTDFDFRGTPDEVLAKLESHPLYVASPSPSPKPGPGRPHLGVVSREVSLLPRHWDWLSEQRGGISATLRRLVDEERKRSTSKDRARQAREAAGKFMWVMAGDRPGFEEASRALYAKDRPKLDSLVKGWPADIRDHVGRLVGAAEQIEREDEVNKTS